MNKIIFISGTPGVGKTTIANNLNNELSKEYDSKLIKINDLAIENDLIQGEDLEKRYKIVDIDKLSRKLNTVINSFFTMNGSFETSSSFQTSDSFNSYGTNSSDVSDSFNSYCTNSSDVSDSFNRFDNNSNNFTNSKIAIVEGHLSHLCDIENININFDFKVIVLRLNPDILQKRLFSRNYSENKIYENLEAEALGVCSVEAYENHGENVNEIDTSDLTLPEVLNLVKAVLFDEKYFPVGNVDFINWILE